MVCGKCLCLIACITCGYGHNGSSRLPSFCLEVRDLRLVTAVATQGSLTQASAVLHVSQPALSRHLAQVEARIGAPLFERTGPAWFRRPPANCCFVTRPSILQHLDAAEEALYSSGTRERRVLKVGTECYTGYHWLPGVSNRFAQAHPAVEIEIAFDAAGDPLPRSRKGAIDVALLTEHRPHRGIAVTKLFVDELVAAVSPRHAWASRPFLTPKDFSSVRLLLLSSPETSYVVNRFLAPAGIVPQQIAEYGWYSS